MGHTIALSKAVRVLGVRRHELQRMIHDGKLDAPDGQVDLDELSRRFPAMAMREKPVMERVRHIKDSAFTRRVRSRVAPDTDELETRIQKREVQLSIEQAKVLEYQKVLEDLMSLLSELDHGDEPARREVIDELNRWLLARFRS